MYSYVFASNLGLKLWSFIESDVNPNPSIVSFDVSPSCSFCTLLFFSVLFGLLSFLSVFSSVGFLGSSVFAVLVTLKVYVFVVFPSSAVTFKDNSIVSLF